MTGPTLLCSWIKTPSTYPYPVSHISAMTEGMLSRSTLGHLSQLEVHKLLQCGNQVVSPKGLNGVLEPIHEGRDCQSFLTACRAALQACPSEACGILMHPLQLLTGNMSLAALLAISPQPSTAMGESAPATPHPTASVAPMPKWWHHSSGEEATEPATPAKEPTHLKQKEGKSLMGLKENHWEAFCWDTDLVQVTRQMYFETHHPTFNQEGSHDLSSLFQEIITSANLLESRIHEIQEVFDWTERPQVFPSYD